MKTKQRPEYVAWEKLMRSQIKASENAIQCLMDEAAATRKLLSCQKRMLKKAQSDEARFKK